MRQFAGAITVVATVDGGKPVGLVATSVCSLSTEPPSIVACVNRASSAHDSIVRASVFGITLLHTSQSGVAEHFGKDKASRFSGGGWKITSGVPYLEGAVANFRCHLHKIYDGFSHSILVGFVDKIDFIERADTGCLLWRGKRFHSTIPLGEITFAA
ncbi:flavin reductase [Burkholderia sp. Ac-20344]|nr:flavin reductase [Burkholderia sp. Ac-20344]